MKKIAIFGCGGFGREVTMLIEQINANKPEWDLIGFYDDAAEKGTWINDYIVLGGMEELNEVQEPLAVAIAVGDPKLKKKIHDSILNAHIFYPTLIHPTVITGNRKFLSIGQGCIIGPGNIFTVNIQIGDFVILSIFCSVGHDTIIKDYASFMPAVNISGEVIIGEFVFVGTGAKIINQIEIGRETIVGAGAIVSNSLPEKCTAVGVPAKPIKFHEKHS
ncbi:MAG: acetyltransferase [Ginsengibacter sp.]